MVVSAAPKLPYVDAAIMKRPVAALGCLLCVLTACFEPPSEPTESASGKVDRAAPVEPFFVVLTGPPAVKSIPAGADARSPAAASATKKRVLAIEAEQSALEPLIVAEGAEIVARLSRLANAFQIATDEDTARRIARLPGVARVERVPVIEPSLLSAVPTVGAPAVWAGVPGLKGEGIRIGIIDSGIDYTHADFAGIGTADAYAANDPKVIEPGSFPTTKIVGGFDFVGDAYNPSGGVGPAPDPDPLDCTTTFGEQISGGHGTHVAGIAAGTGVTAAGASFTGPYEASLDPSAFKVGPGVAPLASLYAFKIFGCAGSTTFLTSALDRASDPNMDGSFDDRMDVVNASLGSSFALGSEVTGDMITELTGVGTLVVAAAGNDGQTFFSTGSPASFPEALSVGASVDSGMVNLRVAAPLAAVAAYPAAEGMFTASLASVGPLAATIVVADPALGCTPFVNAAAVAGSIAMIDRGGCPFVDKVANAVAAGAIGAIIVDDEVAPLPFPMSGTPGSSPIAGVMIRQADGATLKAELQNGPVTISLDATDRYTGPGAELLAGFSSRGPSAADGRMKPEISAPGAAIDSAGVGSGTEPRTNQGTSMACPVVAGAAALVRQAKPQLSPIEVKAALMNGAMPLSDTAGAEYTTTVVGAGRVDVPRTIASPFTAAFDRDNGEVGISFGSTIAATATTASRDFEVHNHGATTENVALSVEPTFTLPGIVVTVEPADLTVGPGQSAIAQLTLEFDPVLLGDAGPDPGTVAMQGMNMPQARHYLNQATGRVRMQWASGDFVLPYTGSVRAASTEHGVAPSACGAAPAEGEPVVITREGGGAHPASVISAFQLAALDDPDEDRDPNTAMTDLRAVGLATNLATAKSFAEAFVHFGIAVNGPWSTPARGPVSVVKVRINSNQQGSDDFEIRVEARNPDGPFRDALVASPYDLQTGERGDRIPVNLVLPDVANTYPFNGAVLVVSVNLDEIGVDPATPAFDWTVATERPDLLIAGNDEVKGTFDAASMVLDTARHGLDGMPIFLSGEPIQVALSPEARTSGAPLDVLLLEHTNIPGEQWQVVSLVQGTPDNLTLAASASETGTLNEEIVLTVTNGDQSAPAVVVTGSVTGGELVSATSSAGSCSTTGTLNCALGDMAPGTTVQIHATVRGPLGASVALEASVTSGLPCESNPSDNAATATVSFPSDPSQINPLDEVSLRGGCSCEVGQSIPKSGGAAWLAALGLVVARRSRRVRQKVR